MLFYLDASAWVKRYVQEDGTLWVRSLFDKGERMATASLGYVETVAALSRRLSEAEFVRVEPQVKLDWQNMARFDLTNSILERAVELARQHKLRGADAVHLATASDLHRSLAEIQEAAILVASDRELLAAAQAMELPVQNPATAV